MPRAIVAGDLMTVKCMTHEAVLPKLDLAGVLFLKKAVCVLFNSRRLAVDCGASN